MSHAYSFAFVVGAAGTVLGVAFAVFGPTLFGLFLLAVWMQVTLFILPWVYLCLTKRGVKLPPWLYGLEHDSE